VGKDMCSRGACACGVEVDIVKRDTMEWMYGWDVGDANGSPAAVIGNLRESVEARERRNTEVVAGYVRMGQIDSDSDETQVYLKRVKYKCLDITLALSFEDPDGFWS
jgi:hypothetical protein